jgi:hypothetical protein
VLVHGCPSSFRLSISHGIASRYADIPVQDLIVSGQECLLVQSPPVAAADKDTAAIRAMLAYRSSGRGEI